MSHESIENGDTNVSKKPYAQRQLTDYGKMSELTKTDPSGTGFDGGDTPSSYIS